MNDRFETLFRRVRATLLAAMALLVTTGAVASHVVISIRSDIGLFYDELTPYGFWLDTPNYGLVWVPYNVPMGWRPYTLGGWTYTKDQGWLWSSDLAWGWATFHYGRWFYHEQHGWAWVPDIQWSPAWVAWREGEDLVGWAPLPPEAKWLPGSGWERPVQEYLDGIPDFAWSFVEKSTLLSDRLKPHIRLAARNVSLLAKTHDATRYEALDADVFNRGVDVRALARLAARPLQELRIIDVTYPDGVKATQVPSDAVAVFRPFLDLRTENPRPKTLQPPDKAVTGEQLKRQHDLQRYALERYHATERTELLRLQQEDLRGNPQAVSAHPAESEALERQIRREQALMMLRHQGERERLPR